MEGELSPHMIRGERMAARHIPSFSKSCDVLIIIYQRFGSRHLRRVLHRYDGGAAGAAGIACRRRANSRRRGGSCVRKVRHVIGADLQGVFIYRHICSTTLYQPALAPLRRMS